MDIPPPPPPQIKRPWWKKILLGGCVGIVVLALLGIGFSIVGFLSLFDDFGSISSEVEEQYLRGSGTDKIVIIDVQGVIGLDDGTGSGVFPKSIKESLDKATSDSDVKAVILDIDSPGGTVVASAQIYEQIKKFDKPIIAFYSGEAAASGAVYLSLGADQIVSYPETLTGSIGVVSEFFDLSELLSKYGVKINVLKSGEFKDMGSSTRAMTDEEKALLQDLIDESYDNFVAAVTAGRNINETVVRGFADGRVFSGRTALDLKMVDALGDIDTAESVAKTLAGLTEAQIVKYEIPTPFGSLLGGFVSQFGQTDVQKILNKYYASPGFRLMYLMK